MAKAKIDIDPEEVYKLAQLGCPTTEIAAWFKCSVDTIDRRFADELDKGRANLRMSLRQWQIKSAKDGSYTMQIWLGKQMLGQTEKTEFSLKDKESIERVKQLQDKPKTELIKLAEELLKKECA